MNPLLVAAATLALVGQAPELDAAQRIADAYWTQRDVPAVCPPEPLRIADLSRFNAEGGTVGCDITLDANYVATALAEMRAGKSRFERRWYAARLCSLVIHETGHARGLPHGAGVMSVNNGRQSLWKDQPRECRAWALKLTPRRSRFFRTGFTHRRA